MILLLLGILLKVGFTCHAVFIIFALVYFAVFQRSCDFQFHKVHKNSNHTTFSAIFNFVLILIVAIAMGV